MALFGSQLSSNHTSNHSFDTIRLSKLQIDHHRWIVDFIATDHGASEQ